MLNKINSDLIKQINLTIHEISKIYQNYFDNINDEITKKSNNIDAMLKEQILIQQETPNQKFKHMKSQKIIIWKQ